MARLKEEGKKVRGEMSERNKPLEVAFISKPATLLSVPEARQAYNLLYQLTNFLIQDDKTIHWDRQRLLFQAICEIPAPLVEKLSLEERVTHVGLLQEMIEERIDSYRRSVRWSSPKEHLKPEVFALSQTLRPHIALLQAMVDSQPEESSEELAEKFLEEFREEYPDYWDGCFPGKIPKGFSAGVSPRQISAMVNAMQKNLSSYPERFDEPLTLDEPVTYVCTESDHYDEDSDDESDLEEECFGDNSHTSKDGSGD